MVWQLCCRETMLRSPYLQLHDLKISELAISHGRRVSHSIEAQDLPAHPRSHILESCWWSYLIDLAEQDGSWAAVLNHWHSLLIQSFPLPTPRLKPKGPTRIECSPDSDTAGTDHDTDSDAARTWMRARTEPGLACTLGCCRNSVLEHNRRQLGCSREDAAVGADSAAAGDSDWAHCARFGLGGLPVDRAVGCPGGHCSTLPDAACAPWRPGTLSICFSRLIWRGWSPCLYLWIILSYCIYCNTYCVNGSSLCISWKSRAIPDAYWTNEAMNPLKLVTLLIHQKSSTLPRSLHPWPSESANRCWKCGTFFYNFLL